MEGVIIAAAFVLDSLVGDPQWGFHPVRLVGKMADYFEKLITDFMGRSRGSGIICLCGVFIVSMVPFFIFWVLLAQAESISSTFVTPRMILGILIVYFSFAQRDLVKHALAVKKALAQKNIAEAREKLSFMVSRDTEELSEKQIIQSALESLAENYCDSVFAPLFYAFFLGPLGAWAYRIINTLDAMWGYKNNKYREFGFAAAKLDDYMNFIPARLSALFLMAVSFITPGLSGIRAAKAVIKDAAKHKSPNSGYPEAAAAGALGIAFGGEFIYFGKKVTNVKIGQGEARLGHFSQLIFLLYMTTLIYVGLIVSGPLIAGSFK